ncbi:uncharacterized protein LOC142069689 [Caretta caretta]|uniref:uncharacterized protein LOC142069689 n=1 Tax=Caretta caretta TaxID=8467 RepID=UPI003F4BBF0C
MARGANPKQRLSAPAQSQRPRLSPPAGPSRQLRTPTRRRRVPVHRQGRGGPCQASCRLLSPAGAAQVSPPAPPLPCAQCGAASRLAPGSCCFPARVPPLRRGRTRTWPGHSLPWHRCPKHETRAIPPSALRDKSRHLPLQPGGRQPPPALLRCPRAEPASAAEALQAWPGPSVRQALYEPRTRNRSLAQTAPKRSTEFSGEAGNRQHEKL